MHIFVVFLYFIYFAAYSLLLTQFTIFSFLLWLKLRFIHAVHKNKTVKICENAEMGEQAKLKNCNKFSNRYANV